MTDVLLELSKSPLARKLVSSAGLPIPMPEELARPKGPSTERFLEGKTVLVTGDGAASAVLAGVLPRAGAKTLVGTDALRSAIAASAEAFGRQVGRLPGGEQDNVERVHALVIDATAFSSTADLKQLYNFFHGYVRAIGRSGRVVVIGRPSDTAKSLEEAAVENALEGFTRSLAKEIGGKGSTANLVLVEPGAEKRLPAVLRFFLSAASAFVSAQPLRVTEGNGKAEDPWESPLAGKVALVTGAARGIGEATARILAGEGARVICLDRPDDDEATSKLAREIGGVPLLADVSDPEAAGRIASDIQRATGGVDIVVHNAGVTRDKTIARMDDKGWDMTIGINLSAIIRITQELIDTKTLRDNGRIISLSSIAGIAGNMGQTNYAASKSGVIGFTRFLAKSLASRGITVNAVAPGFIETRMTAAIPVVIREAGRRLSALGQGGQPEDVARTIAFLATPGAAGVSGQVLRVCGGALIGA